MARGFDIGRMPFAPGTFGTLLGVPWFWLLLLTGSPWLFMAGTTGGFALSVWLCGRAETILHEQDPPSVVLDEITAIPVCFLPWVLDAWVRTGQMPSWGISTRWLETIVVFTLFRLFDIWKPWPVRQSQHLPGGWGVTVDDFLAAGYVAGVVFVLMRMGWFK